MIEDWKRAVLSAIATNAEVEQCGVILGSGSAIALENIASDPSESFVMEPGQWLKHRDNVKCLFHTHFKDSQPASLSLEDLHDAQDFGIPTLCYHTGFGQWDYWSPALPHPYPLTIEGDIGDRPRFEDWYIGWAFEYGRSDCYELFRLWYQQTLGIELSYFHRAGDHTETLKKDWDWYRQNADAQGFRFLGEDEPRQRNDVLLINIGGHNPSHCAILLDPDTTTALHHLGFGRLSEMRSIAGDIFSRTVATIRHKSQD